MTNDPGQALITGRCLNVGKTTIPQLRALNAHLPLFHNGSANTAHDVVVFYNKRLSMGLSPSENGPDQLPQGAVATAKAVVLTGRRVTFMRTALLCRQTP